MDSAARSNQLIQKTLHLIKSALIERIAAIAAHAKLPAELWCQIFSLLPQGDRFSISRVSKDWRAISTSDPALWSDIDYHASNHKITCGCQTCISEERDPPCTGCGRRVLRRLDNIGVADTVLSRSGTGPLRVDITIVGSATFTAITRVLQPTSNRINYLHISADNNMRVVAFLDGLGFLEKLQQLVIVTPVKDGHDQRMPPKQMFEQFTGPLPTLRHIEIEGPYRLITRLDLPALEYARLPIHDVRDLGLGLAQCNNIRKLHYELGNTALDILPEPEILMELRNRLVRLAPDLLVISNINAYDTSAIIQVVHIPDLRDLTLAFRQYSTVPLEAFNSFRDIKSNWSLLWKLGNVLHSVVTLSAMGSNGMARRIVWDDGAVEDDGDLWAKLPPLELLHRIELDSTSWHSTNPAVLNEPYFINGHFKIPDMPQVRELCLEFYDIIDITAVLSGIGDRLMGWPRLVRVIFQFRNNTSHNKDRRRFAEEVVRVFGALTIPLQFMKLKVLEIQGLDLLDDVSCLSKIAECFVPAY